MRDFLVEIQTEELPPKAILQLAAHFLHEIQTRLMNANLTFDKAHYFATPRRLAVLVKNLLSKQPDSIIERKGPAISAAFDSEGKPTPACLGFARSLKKNPSELITLKNPQGEWVGLKQTVKGKSAEALLPEIVQLSLSALPIPKRMRWNEGSVSFVRPVHSVMLLYGSKVIPGTLLGLRTQNKTRGHRFHSKGWVTITNPAAYERILEKKFVIADFLKRKNMIRKQAVTLANRHSARVMMDEDLLDEVTGLVEWPQAIYGQFDKTFLALPREVLISAMQDHQRYFPIMDKKGNLLPAFITISNIKSKNVKQVTHGNERVLRARLADAAFFFETDKKTKSLDRVDSLKTIVFQQKLGSLYDKMQRIVTLSGVLAWLLNVDKDYTKLAARLSKVDLTTQLVGEFPEVQGVAGYYYALSEGIPITIASPLYEQYLPRFSGDTLPESLIGCILAISDRVDTLVGIFGINLQPTGDKDPFGLRRKALGVLRILIEKKLNINLYSLLEKASEGYNNRLENKNVIPQVFQFMLERLRPWYQEQGISSDIFSSVAALKNITDPYDMHQRIQAVKAFKTLKEAQALSIANKRVNNILSAYTETIHANTIDEALFELEAEKNLAEKIGILSKHITTLTTAGKYDEVLTQLAALREPVDIFFDKVLVMTEDKKRRENRLLLLMKLRELFLHVADIALLQ